MADDDIPRELFLEFLRQFREFIDSVIESGGNLTASVEGATTSSGVVHAIVQPATVVATTTIPTPIVNAGITAADMAARSAISPDLYERVLDALGKLGAFAAGAVVGGPLGDLGTQTFHHIVQLAEIVTQILVSTGR